MRTEVLILADFNTKVSDSVIPWSASYARSRLVSLCCLDRCLSMQEKVYKMMYDIRRDLVE